MKKIIYALIPAAFLFPGALFAGPNHGPVFKGYYAPYGAGSYTVPYDRTINGGTDNSLTSGSESSDENSFQSLSGYSISCGYFYDRLQGDISYTKIKSEHQYVENSSLPDDRDSADASLWNADIRAGYRFNNSGDTSYKWLYVGLRRMNLDISYNDTEAGGTGFMAGLYSFSSYGFSGPLEFVFTYDLYACGYRYSWNDLKTDVNFSFNRSVALDFGISAGVGVQYEPWDLAVIVKASPFISYRKYQEEDADNDRETEAALKGTLIGIEVVFSIPDYKNNILE